MDAEKVVHFDRINRTVLFIIIMR